MVAMGIGICWILIRLNMANRAFCIGNGTSRKGFKFSTIKGRGVILGCNNLYKDFAPDILVAMKHPVMHKIYQSGYGYTARCYFRDWAPNTHEKYETMLNSFFPGYRHIRAIRQSGLLKENQRVGSDRFCLHGYDDEGQRKVNVSWLTDDLVKNFTDIQKTPEQTEWATGPASGYVACKEIAELKEVYLIGHDIYSMSNKFNNIYAGQEFYKQDTHPSQYYLQNWIFQWRQLFKWYHWVKFYKVNRKAMLNVNIPEWNECRNLEYISYERMEAQTRSIS